MTGQAVSHARATHHAADRGDRGRPARPRGRDGHVPRHRDRRRTKRSCATPRPLQAHVPLLVGGNHRRLLEFAGAHADIVGIAGLGRTLEDGHQHTVRWSEADVDRTIATIRDAARSADDTAAHRRARATRRGHRTTVRARPNASSQLVPSLSPGRRARVPVRAHRQRGRARRPRYSGHHERWGIDRFTVRADAFDVAARLIKWSALTRSAKRQASCAHARGRVLGGGLRRVLAVATELRELLHLARVRHRVLQDAGDVRAPVRLREVHHRVADRVIVRHVADRADDRPRAAVAFAHRGDRGRFHVERDHTCGLQLRQLVVFDLEVVARHQPTAARHAVEIGRAVLGAARTVDHDVGDQHVADADRSADTYPRCRPPSRGRRARRRARARWLRSPAACRCRSSSRRCRVSRPVRCAASRRPPGAAAVNPNALTTGRSSETIGANTATRSAMTPACPHGSHPVDHGTCSGRDSRPAA